MSGHFFYYNNKFYPENTAVISSGNRSLRYGDGLFETMKVISGKIINDSFHFERLFTGLSILQFEIPKHFTPNFLQKGIQGLLEKNGHLKTVRVRLMIFRSNGGVFDPENLKPNYIIESWALNENHQLNENGLVTDVFPDARKSCDIFSNLKTNNYLPYVMAAFFAKKNKLNDCIVLNASGRICDSVIANIFIIKNKKIYTPPLSEGCVAGIMRRWMIEKFPSKLYEVVEKELTINDLLDADEFFLTNSIYHFRWVKTFREKNYSNAVVKQIYKSFTQTI
ncbi:MAG: aminotransferase class IV [Bacteroidota bacterium]|nr:aminotransferase class IV [Bacteroidota bacterium]